MFSMFTLTAALALGQSPNQDADTFFELKIRPVLAGTCFQCHGDKKVSRGLRVDSREALVKGGKSGPAIVPGRPERSLLIQAIRQASDELKMPPDRPLSRETVEDFVAWVKNGAHWPESKGSGFHGKSHWAFDPVRKPMPPPCSWSDHPVDRFIAAKWSEHGLGPVGPADRRALLRRVTFDLVGLPPTPVEMTAFLADDSPTAFEKVVDRLLASPHYGERWGRHWMDVVRYADTAGDNADYPVPEARLYRDYIIDSFNADKPYDQFVHEQLAGDILARQGPRERYAERLVATGFLALSRRYATAPYELWHLTMEDTIETTGRTFLGLTLRCARCHDHKFDPVTREDYYGLYGMFASTQFPWAGGEEFHSKKFPREHFVPLAWPEETAPRLTAFKKKTQEVGKEIERLQKAKEPQVKVDKLRTELVNLLKPGLPADVPGAYAVQDGKPVDVPIQQRGEPDKPGPVVKRTVPRFLAGKQPFAIPEGQSGRLQFAQWLTRPENPLTARVMVNRLWQHHFGRGIVGTPSNFGLRGEEPTHPELLDWLAVKFVDSGWSIKAMHRLIVTSRTYQLASAPNEGDAARDPGNRWYWRFDRRRLDAESIRDAMLSVSGKLDRKRPGPHPFPPIERWVWTQHNAFKEIYPSNHRSVYLMTPRIQRHPYLALFDGPDANTTTEQRGTSTVPLQALFLMNNPFVSEQAEAFARRLIAAGPDPRQRIDLAHRLAWSRPASAAELEKGIMYVQEYANQLAVAGTRTDRRELETWSSFARIVLTANEFFYLD